MSYKRVLPRDFFNEAKLLKCMGQLSLKILDKQLPFGLKIDVSANETDGDAFHIYQSDTDGSLFIGNYTVQINDTVVNMTSKYNSKDQYPLLCYYNGEETEVFDNMGNFTDEFIQRFTNF